MGMQRATQQPQRRYELEERTARFGEESIALAKAIPPDPITLRLVREFVAAATSVGADYCGAMEAASRDSFRDGLACCKSAARRAKHYLRLIAFSCAQHRDAALRLLREAQELTLIFAASVRTIDRRRAPQAPHGAGLDT